MFDIKKLLLPGRHGSMAECQPMDQEITIRFPARAHAWAAGLIPSVGRIGGS